MFETPVKPNNTNRIKLITLNIGLPGKDGINFKTIKFKVLHSAVSRNHPGRLTHPGDVVIWTFSMRFLITYVNAIVS